MSKAHKFAAAAGALYLAAGIGVPIAISMRAQGMLLQSLRELPENPETMYVLSTSATLVLVVLSLVIGILLLVRRQAGMVVFWIGVAMGLIGAALSIVPALIWLIPVPFIWLANRSLVEPAAVHRPPTPVSSVEGPQSVRSWLYLACLALIGGGAILSLLRSLWLPIPYVPVVGLFEAPIAAFIQVLNLKAVVAQFGVMGTLERLLSLAVSLFVAALAIRRAKLMRESRSISAPPSFSGFPYGLAWAALALLPAALAVRALAFPMADQYVVVNAFLAFVLAEVPDFLDSRKRAAADPEAPISVPAAAAPRRRPTWTFLSVVFAVLGTIVFVVGLGIPALGIMALMALTASCALGLVASVVAVVRKERWIPAQVVAFQVNFGVTGAFGIAALGQLFRFG